jgi:hypothetical protein
MQPTARVPHGRSTTGTAGSSPPDMTFAVGILVPAYDVLLPVRASTHLRWSAAHGCITAFLPLRPWRSWGTEPTAVSDAFVW